MIKAIKIKIKSNFYKSYNIFIYYLSKIFPIKTYKIGFMENVLLGLSIIWALISQAISKAMSYIVLYSIYIGLLFKDRFWFTDGLSKITSDGEIFLYLFTTISLISILVFSSSIFYTFSSNDYGKIKIMRLKPKNYLLGNLIYKNIMDIFISIPILYFSLNLFYKIDMSILSIASFMIFKIGLELGIIYLSSKFNFKDKKSVNNFSWILALVGLIILALMYLYNIYYQKIIDFSFLYTYIFGVIGLILSIIFIKVLLEKDDIDQIVYRFLNKADYYDSVDLDNIDLEYATVKDINLDKKEKDFSKYKGIVYINKIFFERIKPKSFFKRNIKAIFISILLIASIIFLHYRIDYITDIIDNTTIQKYSPIIVFLLSFFLFNDDSYIKKCFVNLDVKFIRYKFYRQPEIILESIKVRIIEILKVNAVPIIIYLIGLIFLVINLNFSIPQIVITLVFAILGVLFFSNHYLFMYYIFQPYTEKAESKNPLYKFFTFFVHMFLGILVTNFDPNIIGLAVIIFLTIYLLFIIYAIHKIAPKNFKLR